MPKSLAKRYAHLKGEAVPKALSRIKCNIKLGMEDGTAFVYCGKGGLDAVDVAAIELKLLRQDKKNASTANYKWQSGVKNYPTPEAYVRRMYRSEREELSVDLEGYMKDLMTYFNKCKSYARQKTNAQEKFEHRIPLQLRRVTDIYDCILEEDTVIVIVEGQDNGRAWTTDEYNALTEDGIEEETDGEDQQQTEG